MFNENNNDVVHNLNLDRDLIKNTFPELNDQDLMDEIIEVGSIETIPSGQIIMDVGKYIKTVPLIIEGSIRILREDEDGRELFLYYLRKGETCAVSLTCCMASEKSSIRAICEEDTVILRVPVQYVDIWTAKYIPWKNFVMNTYRDRYEELLSTIDSIAFMKLDERLWKYLINKVDLTKTTEIKITHQEIADDLHSTREVISRLLKQLEGQGKIKLGRNSIKINY